MRGDFAVTRQGGLAWRHQAVPPEVGGVQPRRRLQGQRRPAEVGVGLQAEVVGGDGGLGRRVVVVPIAAAAAVALEAIV